MLRNAILLGLLLLATSVTAGDLTVTYGYPWVWDGPDEPPSDFSEGTVKVIIAGVPTLEVMGTVPGLRRIDDSSFSLVFLWNDTTQVNLDFVDGEGDDHHLELGPTPPAPDSALHDLPLINVSCDPVNLWDPETGIYCWGQGFPYNWQGTGVEWEREAVFTYTDTTDLVTHQRPIGLRIHGGSSRAYPNKPLRFYFDRHGAPEVIEDDFFGDGQRPHARLLIRSADSPDQYLADPLATSLFGDLGHKISRWSPVAAYLNNSYWGLYHLRERMDDEWAEITHGYTGDYDLIKDGEVDHGSIEDWMAFLHAVDSWEDPEDHEFCSMVQSALDVESYLDWVLFNIMLTTADHGEFRNTILLRAEGGLWEFGMWDEDLVLRFGNRHHDFFTFFASSTEEEFLANRPPDYFMYWREPLRLMFTLFDKVADNPVLRRQMMERWEFLRDGVLDGATIEARLDEVAGAQMSETDRHVTRWEWPETHDFEIRIAALHYIIGVRDQESDDHAEAFFADRMLPVDLTEWSAVREGEDVTLAWRTEQETATDSWQISRAEHPDGPYTVVLDAIPAAGSATVPTTYEVTDIAAPTEAVWYRLTHVLAGGEEVTHPWTVSVSGPPPGVVLNEFLASNATVIADETGAFADWAELYNPADVPVDLGGYGFTDDLALLGKWTLPEGTTIEAGGYLLIWCDNDPEDGPLHTTFKLSASGEELGLSRPVDGGFELLDSYVFGAQTTDVSEGRSSDGALDWVFFTTPTPRGDNAGVNAVPDTPAAVLGLRVWPNPMNPATTVVFETTRPGPVQLRVYDLAGRHVRTLLAGQSEAGRHEVRWDGRDGGGATVAAGVYHVVVDAGGSRAVSRVTMVK